MNLQYPHTKRQMPESGKSDQPCKNPCTGVTISCEYGDDLSGAADALLWLLDFGRRRRDGETASDVPAVSNGRAA